MAKCGKCEKRVTSHSFIRETKLCNDCHIRQKYGMPKVQLLNHNTALRRNNTQLRNIIIDLKAENRLLTRRLDLEYHRAETFRDKLQHSKSNYSVERYGGNGKRGFRKRLATKKEIIKLTSEE